MKEIPLTQGKVTLVDDEDYEWLNQYKWYAHFNSRYWYAERSLNPGRLGIHQAILNPPSGYQCDHINHNTLDNRRSNLRICTKSQNGMNSNGHKNTSSKHKGVTWNKSIGKWMAQIKKPDGLKHIGLFTSEIEAAQTYDKAALEHFGEFAKLNFN